MTKIKAAFNDLISAIEEETMRKFDALDQKLKDKRIEQLEADLAELKKRNTEKLKEAYKE